MIGEYDSGYESCIDTMVRQMEDKQYRIDCLHKALDKATGTIVDLCGTCPYDFYGLPDTENCEGRCISGIGLEKKCWKEYLMDERWGE